MNKLTLLLFFALLSGFTYAQEDSTWMTVYRESYPKVNDLVHTKLEAKFDYSKSYMNGKVWITLKPHFYTTDSLQLDAKGMDIHTVALVKGSASTPLKYHYDGWLLKIKLDKSYKANENYTVLVDYTAKPNEVKVKGSDAITDAKGLYFINPKGEDKTKPTQIWTQGETEGTSVWCPTIDKPNQKTTDEIIMTVPEKYVTLSNGKLASQKKNSDGTRTDTWKMELPHSPYLFFMGVGDYAIIKDKYKGKEVNYYVEKEYASTARKIFGLTPAMIAYFEKVTGVAYPWVKYSQITGQDYVSGAMENTTATLHSSAAQQDARDLVDGNAWEGVVAHELFHQWFGDYVTCESWSNLTVNESFADYSQYLWKEHQYGSDASGEENYSEMRAYLGNPPAAEKDLVRFYYDDREDMFDLVSYQKGGRILNMLRNYLGDSAFFKGLNVYLTTNKFKNGEAHQLRLALEEVSGRDLNWFFNQWYFGSGHPKVTIDYTYDDAAGKARVQIKQLQANLFRLPVTVDVYAGGKKESHAIWITKADETFTFPYTRKPDLINVDATKFTLWDKTDNKTLENFIFQYTNAGNYVDRREAVVASVRQADNPLAVGLLKTALKDKYYGIRTVTLERLDLKNQALKDALEATLLDIAQSDPKPIVKAKAIKALESYSKKEYKDLFVDNLKDSSYSVAGASLSALAKIDSTAAFAEAKRLMNVKVHGKLAEAVTTILITYGSETDFDYLEGKYKELPISQSKFEATFSFGPYLAKIKDADKFKRGIDLIVAFRNAIPKSFRKQTDGPINGVLGGLAAQKETEGSKDLSEYVKTRMGQ
jgi:aminopeptidase N